MLLDDPLSAVRFKCSFLAGTLLTLFPTQVDAHVGKHLFDHAICGALKDKTRVLVTHALHFLPAVDYIICIDHGQVKQQGTYADLVADHDGAFSQLVREFGGGMEVKPEEEEDKSLDAAEEVDEKKVAEEEPKKGKALMQEEERATGAVKGAGESDLLRDLRHRSPDSCTVYGKFFRAAKGHITVPLLFASLVFMQGAQVLGSYWLVFWSEDEFNTGQGFYM